jgi:hypothetical protein
LIDWILEEVSEVSAEKKINIRKAVEDNFRGICRSKRRQRNDSRYLRWNVSRDFVTWHNKVKGVNETPVKESVVENAAYTVTQNVDVNNSDDDFEDLAEIFSQRPTVTKRGQRKRRRNDDEEDDVDNNGPDLPRTSGKNKNGVGNKRTRK